MRHRLRRRSSCPIILRMIALFSVAAIILLFAVDAKIRPILLRLAHNEAKYNVTNIMNKAFAETLSNEKISYSDIVKVSRDQNGGVKSVEANSETVNRIITYTINSIYEQISVDDTIRCGISVGSLTGLTLLQSRGFEIPIMAKLSRYVDYKIVSTFTDAGINQTKHSIYLRIISTTYTYIPGEKTHEKITSEYLLAETVIVGDVPEAYTGVFQAYTDEEEFDVEDTIMNYKGDLE